MLLQESILGLDACIPFLWNKPPVRHSLHDFDDHLRTSRFPDFLAVLISWDKLVLVDGNVVSFDFLTDFIEINIVSQKWKPCLKVVEYN